MEMEARQRAIRHFIEEDVDRVNALGGAPESAARTNLMRDLENDPTRARSRGAAIDPIPGKVVVFFRR